MQTLPAYNGIVLALGGNTVRLRPSLRAASQLAAPPELFRHVVDFHLGTIREIILTAATDRQEATAFLAQIDSTPLQIVSNTIVTPLAAFVAGFTPADSSTGKKPTSGAPMAWPDVVQTLYRRATGWLGWTPETAWNATPTEITEAFAGWIEHHEALNPRSDDDSQAPRKRKPKTYSADQLRQIEEQGFDP